MKPRLAFLACLLLLSCDGVDQRIVTLAFDAPGERVTVTALTTVPNPKEGTQAYADAEERRSAMLAERDDWALRFAQAQPESETITWQRSHGRLDSVQRTATVNVDQLQKFFYDTPVTITTTRGDGWLELAIYAGASTRANAEQRRRAEKLLDAYSNRAAKYFEALRSMYLYLDEKPFRAAALFTDIFRDDTEERPALSEHEQGLTGAVRASIETLLDTNDVAPDAAQIFDLVYNPFPADVRVKIQTQPLGVEGFTKSDDMYVIHTLDAPEAVAALEGRFISPDPLAVVYNITDKNVTSSEIAAIVAAKPRRTEALVTPNDIAAALVEKMRPAPRYRLRFVTKRAA